MGLSFAHFTPFRIESPARAGSCLTCSGFQGRYYADHLLCERDGARHVVGVPAQGCTFLGETANLLGEKENATGYLR